MDSKSPAVRSAGLLSSARPNKRTSSDVVSAPSSPSKTVVDSAEKSNIRGSPTRKRQKVYNDRYLFAQSHDGVALIRLASFIPARTGEDITSAFRLLHDEGSPAVTSKPKKRAPNNDLQFQKSELPLPSSLCEISNTFVQPKKPIVHIRPSCAPSLTYQQICPNTRQIPTPRPAQGEVILHH